MKIYDVTVAVSESVPIYKSDPTVQVTMAKSIANGSSANVSQLCCGVHTGTHVDAPNHFIDGTRRVHELDVAKLIGPCRVVDVPMDVMAIEPEHLPDLAGIERIVFKTRNSDFWSTPEDGFRSDYTYLTPATATALADAGIKLVGIDYLSIEKGGTPGHPVHVTLLQKEIVILEGADLREVPAGDYELICMPLKYEGGGGDGAPARTVLIKR
jgi:arylformamidase